MTRFENCLGRRYGGRRSANELDIAIYRSVEAIFETVHVWV
ncbi:hypothetical protein C7S14_0425 [Burkholderia cepacia]|nr:hypothetical protein C7S14_0425 [Burkholderia cepacia]